MNDVMLHQSRPLSAHRAVMDGQFDYLRRLYARRGIAVEQTIEAMKQSCTDCLDEGKLEPVFARRVGCIIRGGLE